MADKATSARRRRRSLLWPVLVVVAVLLIGALFLFKPGHHDDVKPLADGIVVADTADRFQVLAPPGWQLVTQANVTGGGFRLTAQDPKNSTNSVELEVDPQGDTDPFIRITDYYEPELHVLSNAGYHLTTSARTKYAGQDAYRFEYTSGSGSSMKQNMTTLFLHAHKVFGVTYSTSAADADHNQMLSLLKSEQFTS